MKIDVERAALILNTIHQGDSLRNLTLNPSVLSALNKQLVRAKFIARDGTPHRYALTTSGERARVAMNALVTELRANGAGDKTMTGTRPPRDGAPRARTPGGTP